MDMYSKLMYILNKIPWSVDPSQIFFILWLWYTWREASAVNVRICDCHSSMYESASERKYNFNVLIENVGVIALRNLKATLVFNPLNKQLPHSASVSMCVLNAQGLHEDVPKEKVEGEFIKGMKIKLGFSDHAIPTTNNEKIKREVLLSIYDLKKQNVRICIYSDDYLVKTIGLKGNNGGKLLDFVSYLKDETKYVS
jgi:hypothetical protein